MIEEQTDTLLSRFETAAERDPSAIAVRSDTAAVTYRVLADASLTLAGRLAPLVADRPGPVAVLLDPGPAQVCAALAAMRCGKPYLPIDPAYPRHRVDRILADAAPAVLVAPPPDADVDAPPPSEAGTGDTPGTSAPPLDAEALLAASRATAGVWGDETRVDRPDAYVIYTSGSTGTPKGIVVRHRGILNLLDECVARRELPPRSRYSTCASPGFDAAVLEAWTALTTGGELVVTPDTRRWHPGDFADWLAGERIAHAYVPAAFLPALAEGLREGLDLRSLRRIIVAVEPIPRGLLGGIKRALPDLTLINGYGPTEAAVCVTMYEVGEHDDGPERTPIGTAIRGIDLRVEPLEAEAGADEPAGPADGVRGELHIGGVGVGRYLRPENDGRPAFYTRTAEDGTEQPYYRTGDIVRVDPAGVHTFLGRVDDMIKVRGYRVEPGDVEHALLEHPGLAQAVVLKRPSPDGTPGAGQLVAYVIAAPGTRLVRSEVYKRLRARLPWYAVPHQVVFRDAFPLTGHGKIDRQALAADRSEPVDPADPALVPPPYEHAPHPDAEPALLSLWHDVLGPGTSDPRVSFLANGGDSLAAGRMSAALMSRLGRRVKVLDILLAEDYDDLQAVLRRAPAGTAHERGAGWRDTLPGEVVPATYGQRGLWFHDALHPGSVVYNEPIVLRLRGALDATALSRAIGTIVERHEALRTDLVMSGDELRQVVRPPSAHELTVQDLSAVPAVDRAAAVEQAVRETVRQPFDLATGPHLRSRLLRCGEREHVLVLSLHHSVFDGGSADILFEELSALHTAYATGAEPVLAPPPSQYADHAVRQHTLIAEGHLNEDLAYWREQLSGLPDTMNLPTDFPRPENPSGDGALVRGRLSPELTRRVDALARAAGATRYTAMLSALQILLTRYCGTDDVAVGTPFSGRDRPETERAVGYYLNTLPLRADLRGDPTFRQLLARTRQTVTDAYTHQRVPYGFLVEEVHGASPTENPYLQVCLVPEDVYRHEMTFAGIESTFEYYDTGIAKFDLTVNLIPDTEGGLRLTAEYRTDLFRASTIERLLGHFRTLLESATAEPDVPVARLSMLPAAERALILGPFAGDGTPRPAHGSRSAVHELVDGRAALTPDAPALRGDGQQLTYRELVARADRLANYLAERGAEPGARIGVCLPRGVEAVVAFLAVLKTGSAYVPLDPAFPRHRLAFMADDADLVLSLTPDLLEEDREAIADSLARPPTVAVTGDDIAYVTYTSGSTGQPKGVLIPHRAVADLALGARDWAGVGPESRLLLLASLSFDMVTFDIWAALVNGALLVVGPAGAPSTEQVAALIGRHGVTHGDLPTALFHRQIEEDPASLAGLRTVVVGGEVMNPALAAAALAANPGLRLINGYGPTEATTYATYHVLTGPHDVTDPVPLGRPTPGTRVRILDVHRQPVPLGVTGELHLGGPGLADGYLNRPDLTAERFTADPFDPLGGPLYATGDLARWRPDGAIDYAGRIDGQLKLYGYRVEPGDIEAALRAHPDVTHAVVTRREDRPGHPYLAAYYTTAPGARVSSRELTDLAATRLPGYMVPRVFTALDRIPVTEGGKTDRAALPPPAAARAAADGEPEAHEVPDASEATAYGLAAVQEQIAGIWREIVTTDTLGPDERLFDIGGASLHVALIHQRVAERFGLSGLRMIDLFSHPTVRGYAAHVHELCVRERAGER